MKNETITLGGGCFWCLEAIFSNLRGVESAVSGYAGGQTENPSYTDVCTGNTGHAEVIQIKFNPNLITIEDILDVFWKAHDPTTLNRQGNDVGNQYRSTIMPNNDEQQETARKSIKKFRNEFNSPITTIIEPLNVFYKAEENHQGYFRLNPKAPYCALSIEPKIKKLKDDNVLP